MNALAQDVGVLTNWRPWRWLTCWFRPQFWAVASYRLERVLYLHSGSAWPFVRLASAPLFALIRPRTVDIRPEASIGPGLLISHPALGVVVSMHSVIGARVTLTGGNCIGIRDGFVPGDALRIGDGVDLGANAVVLGPVRVGDNARVGAGAIVTHDVPNGCSVRAMAASSHPA